MILVVASTEDEASLNIRRQLLAHYDFHEAQKTFNNKAYRRVVKETEVMLVTIDEEAPYFQDITAGFDPELVVYISRHSSRSGTPTLSVHAPGNLTHAQKGGVARKLSIAPAAAMKEALVELARQQTKLHLDYQVSYECTHHGPSLDAPALFVELGSSLTQWRDVKAAEAVAHAVMASISGRKTTKAALVGIGGPHYNRKFTRMALEGPSAFGHMVPKYAVSEISKRVLKQCVERTVETVEAVVLDWKGIKGRDRAGLTAALDELAVRVERA